MPSYVVTGVSRGVGWALLNELSADSNNKVIGIVRNAPATEKRVKEELSGRANITILAADLTDYDALKKAAADVSALTDGKLDYLLANAASVSDYDAYETLASLGSDPAGLTNEFRSVMDTNVLSAIHLVNLFMPLVLAGAAKKVVIISTGLADRDLTNDYELELAPIYAISKAAVNMVVAKFNATYKKDGVLFLALSPGLVDVGKYPDPAKMNPVHLERMQNMFGKFKAYAPNFKGPIQPEESATKVLSFIHRATVAEHGGAFMSHLGTKTWLESEP